MPYAAVCFDLDGVICNSEAVHEAAFQSALHHYGLSLTPRQYKDYFAGKTDEQGFVDYAASLRVVLPVTRLLELKHDAFTYLAPHKLKYYPKLPRIIKNLANTVPLALVTGSSAEEAAIALSQHGLGPYFSVIITAHDTTWGKPDPEGYMLAAKRLGGIRPKDCLAIEDSPSGVLAAQSAGMFCVAVTTTHSAKELAMADAVESQLTLETLNRLMAY